ncbi:MAG: hypothetical protein QOI89_3242 [Solirubrobacteraceae bacterium]|jgi:hypothetical protein|nr:hypothetical protein [Solirubrobacteraceae bacterium]
MAGLAPKAFDQVGPMTRTNGGELRKLAHRGSNGHRVEATDEEA